MLEEIEPRFWDFVSSFVSLSFLQLRIARVRMSMYEYVVVWFMDILKHFIRFIRLLIISSRTLYIYCCNSYVVLHFIFNSSS